MSKPKAVKSNEHHSGDDKVVELSKLRYSSFENLASDQRNPALKTEEAMLTDREIARSNLAPEKIADLLDRGAIITLRRNIRDDIPLAILFAVALLIILRLTVELPATPALFPVQVFIPLAFIAVFIHRHFNSKYFIENDGVTVVKGFLLFNLSRLKCNYDKIKVVEVYKNILQRVLLVGNIRISTALVDQPEIILEGVANPYFYVAVIKLRINQVVSEDNQELHDGLSVEQGEQKVSTS